jgi:hypothetical protein
MRLPGGCPAHDQMGVRDEHPSSEGGGDLRHYDVVITAADADELRPSPAVIVIAAYSNHGRIRSAEAAFAALAGAAPLPAPSIVRRHRPTPRVTQRRPPTQPRPGRDHSDLAPRHQGVGFRPALTRPRSRVRLRVPPTIPSTPSLSVFGETPRASGFGLQGMTGDQSRDLQQLVGGRAW